MIGDYFLVLLFSVAEILTGGNFRNFFQAQLDLLHHPMSNKRLPLNEWRMGFKSLGIDEISQNRKKKFKLPSRDTFDG